MTTILTNQHNRVKNGSYRTIAHLATSEMSVVYSAINRQGQTRAVKVGQRRDIWDEYDLIRTIHHPNVVRPYSRGHIIGQKNVSSPLACELGYFSMEFLTGANLLPLKYTPLEVISHLLPVCEGLLQIWEKGMCHGDFKPNQMIHVANRGWVVFDFGIGAWLWMTHSPIQKILGTLPYITPEYLFSKARFKPSPAHDFFAITISIYHLLVGKYLLPQAVMLDGDYSYWYRHHHERTQYSNDKIPGPVYRFMVKAGAFDPKRRIADPRQFMHELAEARRKLAAG